MGPWLRPLMRARPSKTSTNGWLAAPGPFDRIRSLTLSPFTSPIATRGANTVPGAADGLADAGDRKNADGIDTLTFGNGTLTCALTSCTSKPVGEFGSGVTDATKFDTSGTVWKFRKQIGWCERLVKMNAREFGSWPGMN